MTRDRRLDEIIVGLAFGPTMTTPMYVLPLDSPPLDALALRCEKLFEEQQAAERRVEEAHAELMAAADESLDAAGMAELQRSYRVAQTNLYLAQLAYEGALTTLRQAVADACESLRFRR